MKMIGDLVQWVRRDEWIRDIFRIQDVNLPDWQQRILFVVRKLLSSWLRFRDSRSAIQVGALSYLTLISLVPVLAFSFSIVKTLGLHQQLQNDVIDPLLNQWIPTDQAPELRSGIEQMLLFVSKSARAGRAGTEERQRAGRARKEHRKGWNRLLGRDAGIRGPHIFVTKHE